MATSTDIIVRHFRQILIWPLQLMPYETTGQGSTMGRHWMLMLEAAAAGSPWQPRPTEFDGDPAEFQERHYREFVTFLPYVQRFLYGEGRSNDLNAKSFGQSPLHVFRRNDVRKVVMMFKDGAVHHFTVAHIDLYFFYDIDVVILAFEIQGDNLPLKRVQDALFRFGRAFPAQWDENQTAASCLRKVAWLGEDGEVLASSDYEDRATYLSHLGRYRAPKMAAHWEYLLNPLVLHHSAATGALRYRQIEYHRMPILAYVAVDDPFALSEEDFYRLGMVTRPGDGDALPYTRKVFEEFEQQCCYDRFWIPERKNEATSTRMMCNGHAFVLVGKHGNSFFSDPYTGALGQFRHQYFLLTLIAHFHKAALLMFSDRLAVALANLNLQDAQSIRQFKRETRHLQEAFLRFNQRYWFREVSNQIISDQIYQMLHKNLEVLRLHQDVRDSIQSMSQYLENDDLRRQADTVVRLTVVTIFGLIGTTVTGFLGMNLFSLAEQSVWDRTVYFFIVFITMLILTFVTVAKSKGFAEFLDAVADDRIGWSAKLAILLKAWKRKKV
ncbi:CorA family divalent cation transporter [Deefgea rivuli]|uniref:CorA family divalent cation transporter n=1 Tax=Deefgea rivuli TaxID=400948 RepID=UPI00055B05FE|nr:CorA family divalent cation transporter [Deefgea rivuli]